MGSSKFGITEVYCACDDYKEPPALQGQSWILMPRSFEQLKFSGREQHEQIFNSGSCMADGLEKDESGPFQKLLK